MNVSLTPEDLVGQGTADGGLAPFAVLSARPEPATGRADFAPSQPDTAGEPTEPTAERLAECAKAGSLDSFEQLVARYESPIFNFLRQFTGNHHDAEDLTQETFVKAYRSLHRYDSSFAFAAWLFTIARRTGASHFRSARRFSELPATEESTEESPATALECKDEQTSIWKLVWTLKPKQAEALWLRYAEGFSVAETARIMRTNQIHVKVLLHRARTRLSRIITTRRQVLRARTGLRGQETGNRQGLEKQKAFL